MKRLLAIMIVALLLASLASPAQYICVKNGKPCSQQDIDELVCKPEKAPANLSVAYPVRLMGTLTDITGARIDFDSTKPGYQTIVQIRNIETGEVLFAVPLRNLGEFAFESVPSGSYRLVAVWMHDGRLKRLPLADQPGPMTCKEKDSCSISAIIRFHCSDNPIDSCPPK